MTVQTQEQRTPKMLVVFRAGELRLGIDVRRVREVVRAVPLSVPLRNAGCVVGLITLRGQSTAVVDLNRALGTGCGPRDRKARMIAVHHDATTVCLLVDQVEGLRDVTEAHPEPPPPMIADVNVRWLDCVTRSAAGELIAVIDVDRILSQAPLSATKVETVNA